MEMLQNKGWVRLTAPLMFQPSSRNEKQHAKLKKQLFARGFRRLGAETTVLIEFRLEFVINTEKHVSGDSGMFRRELKKVKLKKREQPLGGAEPMTMSD